MTKPAAFQATVHALRTIPSRGVVSITIEAPIERVSEIAAIAEHGAWVAIARLKPESQSQESPPTVPANTPRKFSSLPLAQQAALLCNDPVFRAFLNEEFGYQCENENDAAEAIRERCSVTSRADLKPNTPAADKFIHDREQFIAWKLVAA